MRYIFFLTCMLGFGCASFNTIKHEVVNPDAFLIKQSMGEDIMCITKNAERTKKTLCFHVKGKGIE